MDLTSLIIREVAVSRLEFKIGGKFLRGEVASPAVQVDLTCKGMTLGAKREFDRLSRLQALIFSSRRHQVHTLLIIGSSHHSK